jgi:hypothetical protein
MVSGWRDHARVERERAAVLLEEHCNMQRMLLTTDCGDSTVSFCEAISRGNASNITQTSAAKIWLPGELSVKEDGGSPRGWIGLTSADPSYC